MKFSESLFKIPCLLDYKFRFCLVHWDILFYTQFIIRQDKLIFLMDKSNFLIDFSSPAQKHELKPLIPVPPQTSLASKEINESPADPFEVPEVEAPDPFDCVLKCAVSSSSSKEAAKGPEPTSSSMEEEVQNLVKCDNTDPTKSFKLEKSEEKTITVPSSSNDNALIKISQEFSEVSCTSKILRDCKDDYQNSHTAKVENNANHPLKNTSKSLILLESDNQSQISSDFSTEESLKAVIAKRVNRCIQETLNGSLKRNQNGSSKPLNKRSLSFIGSSSVPDKIECDRLNKSCTDTFNVENQELDASSDSSSPNSTDVLSEENVENRVFKEARKLSRTFSKLAASFCQDEESDSDDDDLLSCKPRWLYADSSEDEEEKLLKDPALNLRRRSDSLACSSPAPRLLGISDSPALLAYKSRRSFTQLQVPHNNTQEEIKLKRSISVGSHFKDSPALPTLAATVPMNLLKADDQPIKLRKKVGDMKKGPLRAVIPIQSMTKEALLFGGKLPVKQDTSPEGRIQKSAYAMGTPNKDNSHLNITPMASSTPNKAENSSGNTSLLKPVAPVAANKRHSLEGSIGHQSRETSSENGARPRSNSANSRSIPRVMPVKPLRGLPLAPRSVSQLPRTANTQVNVQNLSVLKKKDPSQVKSNLNTRMLSEVKTKSPRQSKVRTAVNALSSLVRGKKTAARDKENRAPM